MSAPGLLDDKPGKQWGALAAIALAVTISNTIILHYGLTHQDTTGLFGWSIAAIGMITFFGILVISSLHTQFSPASKSAVASIGINTPRAVFYSFIFRLFN